MTLDDLRTSLLAQIEGAQHDLEQIKAAKSDATADDEHDPEGSTLTADWQLVSASLASAREQLAAAVRAQARVDAGTYGTCLSCGREIAAARLAERPSAEQCIECAR